MQRDYILRMIEQFGRLAAALRALILGGSAGEESVKEQLRATARQAGLDLELARAATAETVVMLVAPGGEVEPARCWMAAEALYLDGLDAHLTGDGERARASLEKARMLFAMVAPMGGFLVGFPEAAERIREIDALREDLPGRGRRRAARTSGPTRPDRPARPAASAR